MSKAQIRHPPTKPEVEVGARTTDLAPPFVPAFLRMGDVLRITSLSRATLYRRINARRFPAPVHLGGRACGWPVAAVQEWIRDPEGYYALPTEDLIHRKAIGRARKNAGP